LPAPCFFFLSLSWMLSFDEVWQGFIINWKHMVVSMVMTTWILQLWGECFYSALHMTLEWRDTKFWRISGCITLSLLWRAEPTNGLILWTTVEGFCQLRLPIIYNNMCPRSPRPLHTHTHRGKPQEAKSAFQSLALHTVCHSFLKTTSLLSSLGAIIPNSLWGAAFCRGVA
jgi:hypothetical protein